MIKLSASRAVAVEGACMLPLCFVFSLLPLVTYISLDAFSEYSPQNIHQALQQIDNRLRNIDNHLRDIGDHVRIGLAQNANLRVINRNTRLQAPLQLLPVQKTVSLVL